MFDKTKQYDISFPNCYVKVTLKQTEICGKCLFYVCWATYNSQQRDMILMSYPGMSSNKNARIAFAILAISISDNL